MTAGPCLPQPKTAEWRHSGRYFLIAIALHLAVLLNPQTLDVDRREPEPLLVTVQLAEKIAAPQVIPPAAPEKPAAAKPQREKPTPRPILAMQPEQASTPAALSMPAAPAVVAPSAPPAANPAPVAASAPATVSAPRFNAAYLNNPEPKYPSISRRLGEEGKVLLKVRVSADGRAAAVDIEKSSAYDRLDEAARQSVLHWRFVPARRGDEAIEATVIVPVVFRLDS